MEIERINEYQDERFSQKALWQHGCFLADGMPYEVEIISDFEAVIKGRNPGMYLPVIEEFRFYAPQITYFCDTEHRVVKAIRTERNIYSSVGCDSAVTVLCG